MIKNNETPKPKPRKVRGTGTYVGDEFTFKPCAEGESTQRDVKSCKNGKLFTTTSEKKPLQVAHLSCPADSPDPWAEYTRRLIQLGVKPLQPTEQAESERVVSEDGLECWLSEAKGLLTFTGCVRCSWWCAACPPASVSTRLSTTSRKEEPHMFKITYQVKTYLEMQQMGYKEWQKCLEMAAPMVARIRNGEESLKSTLPGACFQAADFAVSTGTKKYNKGRRGRWREQRYAYLSGLVVIDVDARVVQSHQREARPEGTGHPARLCVGPW